MTSAGSAGAIVVVESRRTGAPAQRIIAVLRKRIVPGDRSRDEPRVPRGFAVQTCLARPIVVGGEREAREPLRELYATSSSEPDASSSSPT